MKISVIVPVYNSEPYLLRCVDSIRSQTYHDLEIFLVDDGSPDNCPQICDSLAEKDSRIHVIHQENRGVSVARNTGLDCASGEFVTFVDSDDYIDPCMYERMLQKAQEYSCDVVMCDCAKEFDNRSEIYTHEIRPGYYNLEQLRREYYPHLLMMGNVEYPPTISNCLLLFRRELVSGMKNLKEPIRYIEGVRFSEDLLFGAQLMARASSFFYMKEECYYHYVINPTSATHTFKADKWKDYTKLHHEAELWARRGADYDFSNQLDLMLLFFVYNAVGEIRRTHSLEIDQKKEMIFGILDTPAVRSMFSRVFVLGLPIRWKLKIYTLMLKSRFGIGMLLSKG